jgi:hypothetical protein
MLVVLCGFGDRALKAERSLIDLIMKLRADCSEIHEYLHVSKYDSLVNIGCMRLAAFTLLTPIRRIVRYLAGVEHLTRLGTRRLFLKTYHVCCWDVEPFSLCC